MVPGIVRGLVIALVLVSIVSVDRVALCRADVVGFIVVFAGLARYYYRHSNYCAGCECYDYYSCCLVAVVVSLSFPVVLL